MAKLSQSDSLLSDQIPQFEIPWKQPQGVFAGKESAELEKSIPGLTVPWSVENAGMNKNAEFHGKVGA